MRFRVPLFTLLVVGLATLIGKADDQAKADLPAPGPDGFISLFNGTDLTGWEGLTDFWSVKDGAITGAETKEHAAPQTDLNLSASMANPEKFANFELHFSYKFTTPTGNSGVQFRSQITDAKTFHCGGYQADFDAKQGYDGSIYDESGVAGRKTTISNRGQKTTWTAEGKRENEPLPESAAELKKLIKINDWNDCVVVAQGNHMTYTINGHLMTDLTDNDPKALKDGVIGLQLHHGFVMEVQFKDLKIKFLPAE